MGTIPQDELMAAIKAAREKAANSEGGERPRAWRWGPVGDDEADGLELVGRVNLIEEGVAGKFGERTVAQLTLPESEEQVSLYLDATVLAARWADAKPAVGDLVVVVRSAELIQGKSTSYWGFAVEIAQRGAGEQHGGLPVAEPADDEPVGDDGNDVPF